MSTFDDASLVFIPSGYKTSKAYSVKPIDGSGDLTFTRSNSTASRVASNGLIEKVRTNLILQSNTFSTTWTNLNSTETGGQTGYDGTTNAWLISATGGSAGIIQNISQSGMVTQSVYAKAGTSNWLMLRLTDGTNNNLTYVDLTNRVFGNTGTNFVRGTITDVGGGWSRISVTINQASYNQCAFYVAFGNGSLSTTNETLFIQNAQLEAGDIATDPILTTTAAVSVGPVANVPRLDYLNSSCPRLLLEPQRTNLALWSEQLDNSYWPKSNITVTANYDTSPDGYQNADRVVSAGGSFPQIGRSFTGLTIGTAYSISFYVKSDGTTQAVQSFQVTGFTRTDFTPSNTWQRITYTFTATATSHTFVLFRNSGTAAAFSYLCWGIQWEAGSYVTSYIGPTLGAAVTRGADLASKTGISSLIGQTEGTLFVEFVNDGNNNTSIDRIISVSDGTANNRMYVARLSSGASYFVSVASGTQTGEITGTTMPQGVVKIALAYKNNDVAMYVNGSLIGTDTSHTTPATSNLYLGQENAGTTNNLWKPYKQALLFKTRLSNSDLAALTTL